MNWPLIARRDYRALRAARAVMYVLGLLALAIVFSGYVYPLQGSLPVTTRHFAVYGLLRNSVTYLVPLAGIVLGYRAVVGERRSGTLTLLLAVPHSRDDILVGKYLSRAVLVGGVLVGALVVAGTLVVYPFGSLRIGWYLGFILLTIAYALIFLGIALALSMVTASRTVATLGAIGVYVLSVLLWQHLPGVIWTALQSFNLLDGSIPTWMRVLHTLEPTMLYRTITTTLFGSSTPTTLAAPLQAWYFNIWTALVIFGLWLIVPLAVALVRFRRVDL